MARVTAACSISTSNCVGRGRKLGAIVVIEMRLTSANYAKKGLFFDGLKRLRAVIIICRFV
ncbi:hypothetical protein AERO8C_120414 [Aeromonas veronii]|uniref:Uncharacterized protein n=1 Tax=Aeromonas veronii TaxID=654 RepID=A0A653KS57_AERVE|nr:hypothetical protein AERO8C_120414 [Aeromonas veronii]